MTVAEIDDDDDLHFAVQDVYIVTHVDGSVSWQENKPALDDLAPAAPMSAPAPY